MKPAGLLHRVFEASLAAKALFASVETAIGMALFVAGSDRLSALAGAVTVHELSEDPTDPLARFILHLAQTDTATESFYALYLASHGAIKLVVVAGLAARIRWAYPAAIVVLAGFILYQMIRWLSQPSPGLLLLSLFDLFLIWLTWREYRALGTG